MPNFPNPFVRTSQRWIYACGSAIVFVGSASNAIILVGFAAATNISASLLRRGDNDGPPASTRWRDSSVIGLWLFLLGGGDEDVLAGCSSTMPCSVETCKFLENPSSTISPFHTRKP
ncbi:hypothetical protein SESBI_08835 [Sesbania bispinosa]|nr:hypothetical protein SESBI_08835 [Sesbania bispinosa]